MEIHEFIIFLYLFVDLSSIGKKKKKKRSYKRFIETHIYICVLHLLASLLVAAGHVLLLHLAHTLPLAAQVLLPESDLVVAARDSKDVATQRPAHTPDNISELLVAESLLLPGRAGGILCPDQHSLVLRTAGQVVLGESNVGCPGNIANPVSVSLERLLLLPGLGVLPVGPDLDQVVASSTAETFRDRALATVGSLGSQ